jgi:hypothetical protein
VRPQRARQIDLFQDTDAPQALPGAIEEEVFSLLVQMLQTMIPVVTAEVADEQDHR